MQGNNINSDLKTFIKLAKEFLKEEGKDFPGEYISPKEIGDKIDVSLNDTPINRHEFERALKKIIIATPKTSSKLFFNQLFGGRHSKAVLGDLLAVLLNNSMATYKIAGPQVAIEKEIINKIGSIIGYNKNFLGGTFPTGGSMSNFMSLIMARDQYDIEAKNLGNKKNLTIYACENAHYSIGKNASFSGIGRNNVRYIKSNKHGEMNVGALENKIEKDINLNKTPIYVNTTVGTTVLGSFDDIEKIAIVCKKYNIWLHVDGSYCGSVIFSKKYQDLIKGINLSNSFCFNPHKTLGAPLSCSILLVQNKKHLYNSFSNEADYLYQTSDDSYNLGKVSFECGRRNNALKFWTLWKSIGKKGLSKMIEHEFMLAETAKNYIKANSNYQIYNSKPSLSVCFNYKNFEPEELCRKLYEKNKLMISYGRFKKNKFIRLVTVNSSNTEEDIYQMFKTLENFAEQNKNVLRRT
ncbi:MAG: aminotransferase class V-fold PLP-dependent enzyme [Bacteroidota bacterium]|nr:aminotransferase class V-fold PLP-dependent enzyme [Bacteroidota bacterium]